MLLGTVVCTHVRLLLLTFNLMQLGLKLHFVYANYLILIQDLCYGPGCGFLTIFCLLTWMCFLCCPMNVNYIKLFPSISQIIDIFGIFVFLSLSVIERRCWNLFWWTYPLLTALLSFTLCILSVCYAHECTWLLCDLEELASLSLWNNSLLDNFLGLTSTGYKIITTLFLLMLNDLLQPVFNLNLTESRITWSLASGKIYVVEWFKLKLASGNVCERLSWLC